MPGAHSQDSLYSWSSGPTPQNAAGLLCIFIFCLGVFRLLWQNAWGTQLKEGWFILVHSLRGHHLDGREHRVAGVRWLGISHGVLPHLSFN